MKFIENEVEEIRRYIQSDAVAEEIYKKRERIEEQLYEVGSILGRIESLEGAVTSKRHQALSECGYYNAELKIISKELSETPSTVPREILMANNKRTVVFDPNPKYSRLKAKQAELEREREVASNRHDRYGAVMSELHDLSNKYREADNRLNRVLDELNRIASDLKGSMTGEISQKINLATKLVYSIGRVRIETGLHSRSRYVERMD